MLSKTLVLIVVVVALVVPGYSRPQQAPRHLTDQHDNMETAIKEIVKGIEDVIAESTKKITRAVEESIAGGGTAKVDSAIKNYAKLTLAKVGVTKTRVGSTTTMSPLDEFCKEACLAQIPAPQCDCSGIIIG